MARYVATSPSAPYSTYVYTYYVYVEPVYAAFIPRKSRSKPQTDTSCSTPGYTTQTQTNYKCEGATSFLFLLVLPEIFHTACQECFCQSASSSAPPQQTPKRRSRHRCIGWGWQEQGARAGFTPSISTSYLAPISPVTRLSSHLYHPYTFRLCKHPGALRTSCLCLAALLEQTSSFELVSLSVTI